MREPISSSSRRVFVVGGLAASGLALTFAPARAEPPPPAGIAGRWRTIDDETGQPKAIIEMKEIAGHGGSTAEGHIVELLNPAVPNPVCEECEGDRKNKPVRGMTIVWGMKREKPGRWSGGSILDPKSGKEYRCAMELLDGGARLKVRGYIGVALLGRTQIWMRAP